jgi:hypothetical protein
MGLKYYLHKVMMENCLLTIKSKDSIPFEDIVMLDGETTKN